MAKSLATRVSIPGEAETEWTGAIQSRVAPPDATGSLPMGGFIHVLLILAIVAVLLRIIGGRRAV